MRVVSLFLSLIGLLCHAEKSHADKPAPPSSYKKVSADNSFVFVMVAPQSFEKEPFRGSEEHKEIVKGIRDVYTKSGLYKNDGSKTPLWTVDWYRHSVYVASDGVHLVRMGNWPFMERQGAEGSISEKDLKQEAISFFANGKLLREFSIRELVDDPQLLPKSWSHFEWFTVANMNEDKNQFEIFTRDGKQILFDLTNAKILEKNKVDRPVEAKKQNTEAVHNTDGRNVAILLGALTVVILAALYRIHIARASSQV